MALQTQDRTLGETTFRVTQVPGMDSIGLLARISKLLGPTFAELVRGEKSLQKLMDEDVSGLGGAIAAFFMDLDPAELQALCAEFAKHCQIKVGEGYVPLEGTFFDTTFAGRMDLLLLWLGFCVQVNYASFFNAVVSLVASASAASPTES